MLNIQARLDIQEFSIANLYQYDIDWRWNFFTSHNFAQCSWSSSSTSEKRELNLKFRTDLRDQLIVGWSVTQMISFNCKLQKRNLQTKNLCLSCQCRSIHSFQTLHFVCNHFGCKLWFQSIQDRARHRFQAFARCHLKWQCCSIWISADASFWDRLSI